VSRVAYTSDPACVKRNSALSAAGAVIQEPYIIGMDDLELLIDLHLPQHRQGPGGAAQTTLALTLARLLGVPGLKVLDIGCGTGASTLVLAHSLDAHITAVDFVPAFLTRLQQSAEQAGMSDRITCLAASMDNLPFPAQSFDLIWSEGAIYNIGFKAGVTQWRHLLKPGGVLAVSELTWLTDRRPDELSLYWEREYAEVDTASAKLKCLETSGFTPIGYFSLPSTCWTAGYYDPLAAEFEAFLARQGHSDAARARVAAERAEIALYRKYADFVSYGFYIAHWSDP
jgi:SAM-dependent methyltransferase